MKIVIEGLQEGPLDSKRPQSPALAFLYSEFVSCPAHFVVKLTTQVPMGCLHLHVCSLDIHQFLGEESVSMEIQHQFLGFPWVDLDRGSAGTSPQSPVLVLWTSSRPRL